MVQKFVDDCIDLGSRDLSAWKDLNYLGSYLQDWSSDIFLRLMLFVPDIRYKRSINEVRVVGSNPRTDVSNDTHFFENLRFFAEVLEQQSAPVPHGSGTWTPRVSSAVGGQRIDGYNFTRAYVGDFTPFFASSFGDLGFYDFRTTVGTGPSGTVIPSTFLWETMQEMFSSASMASYWKPISGVYHNVNYTLLAKTDSFISYRLDCHGFYSPITLGYIGTTSYIASVAYEVLKPRITLRIEDARVWRMLTDGSPYYDLSIFNGSYRQRLVTEGILGQGKLAHRSLDASGMSIKSCRPGFYVSQSRAAKLLLGEVSKNFETLMESPGIEEVYASAATLPGNAINALYGSSSLTADAEFLGRAAPPLGYFERLRGLLQVLAGGYLAYIFALRPTLETLSDILKSHIAPLTLMKASKGTILEGDDITNLPNGLKTILGNLSSVNIVRYSCNFRTEMTLHLRASDVVDGIMNLLRPSMALGIFPEPKYIWAAHPFSFLIDEVIPMSQLIDEAQVFFNSQRLKRVRIGHSANVRAHDENGLVYEIYIRSDETDTFLDPTAETWLQSPGLQPSVIIPLGLSLLL